MQDQLPTDTRLKDGRYIVKGLYKKGGQCRVYIGHDCGNDSQVIIKQPEQDWGREGLLEEAAILSGLDHPSLPRIVDWFEEQGSTFIVTTYIPGTDLSELLRKNRGPFNVDEVVGWAEQLLDILEYLETRESSVVHRDINPRNIRLTPDGRVFLLDFGVAKQGNKKTLLLGGSPHFAPPEQLRDEGTDHRSDVYSLAATLYFLLLGTEPPDSMSRENALAKGRSDPLLPASDLNKEVPLYLSRLLAAAMSLEREHRPGGAKSFRHMLRSKSLVSEEHEDETPASPRRGGDPEVTEVSERAALRGDAASQMAYEVLDHLRRGDSIHQDVIQIIAELLDAKPELRPAILKRYRSVINGRKRGDPPLAFNFIALLAENSTPAPGVVTQLRQELVKALAKSPPATSASERQGTERHLINPEEILRAEEHGKWLADLFIWVARGSLITLVVKLILLPIIGKFNIVENVLWANLALVAYSVVLTLLIRRMGQLGRAQKMTYDLPCKLAAFFYGVVLVEVLAVDLLTVIS